LVQNRWDILLKIIADDKRFGTPLRWRKKTATNNPFPQLGAGHCNFSISNLAAVVWCITLLKNISIILLAHFLSALPPGRTFLKPPTDGNAKRYTKRFSLEAQNN